jgi:hypothetical protein
MFDMTSWKYRKMRRILKSKIHKHFFGMIEDRLYYEDKKVIDPSIAMFERHRRMIRDQNICSFDAWYKRY